MVVLRRRRNDAAAGRPLTNVVASPQPGAGVGVGGRDRWAACTTHHRLESTSDRGEDATTAAYVAPIIITLIPVMVPPQPIATATS